MNDAATHTISLVIPTKDRPRLLRRALDSIASQCHRPLEVLVVDDGSAVPCAGLEEEYPGLDIVVFRNEKSIGAAAARNLGGMNARGSLIGFLDDDDEYLPGFLADVLAYWEKHRHQVSLTWCGAEVLHQAEGDAPDGAVPWPVRFNGGDANIELIESQLLSVGIGFGVFVSADVFFQVCGFDDRFKFVEDTDFFLKVLLNGFRVSPLERIGVRLHQHAGDRLTSATNNRRRSDECVSLVWKHRRDLAARPHLLSQLIRRAKRLRSHDLDGVETY